MLSEIRQTPYDFTFMWNVKTKQMPGDHIVRFATQKGNPKVMKLGAHIGAAADAFAPPLHQGERERRDREKGREREREREKGRGRERERSLTNRSRSSLQKRGNGLYFTTLDGKQIAPEM